jgi:hypothetical protein
LIVASTCGSALAAPPTVPPGQSGEAPGHQQKDEPPGQAKKEDAASAEPQAAVAEVPVEPATQAAPEAGPVESPRFENASGKPRRNVPAAAEAAPETSISAPGNSGRHKLTICHKGHAITVDVHAARAHVDGHGDTYAVAGAKGRAACPQPSPAAPVDERPADPGRERVNVSVETAAVADPETARGSPAAPAASPAPLPPRGVSATAREERGAVAWAIAGDLLPFTGAPLRTLVLFGLALVAAGSALVLAARRRPAPSRRC